MLEPDDTLTPEALRPEIERLFELAGPKLHAIQKRWQPEHGSLVFTVNGRYTNRGWTEWTRGFQFGAGLLLFDATDDPVFLQAAMRNVLRHMAPYLTHTGVHDHGFNIVSTYGNLYRLLQEGRIERNYWEGQTYELALKTSGAVQAARWTALPEELGYLYSFHGPHSLFADTMRTLRVLALAHRLGHVLLTEHDQPVNLLQRLLQHAETTARFNVYLGEGRDLYDERGRVAHETIFNPSDGSYRCAGTHQGYSPFSTWTRALAWVLLGFAEQLEFLNTLPEPEFEAVAFANLRNKAQVLARFQQIVEATADFYLTHTPTDGVPYWDTGAPGLAQLGDYLERPADPFNEHEPVDSSAAVIAAQGLLRLGRFLQHNGAAEKGRRYLQAGLTAAHTTFSEPYLATDPEHEGLILHSVYNRPHAWDHVPEGRRIPCGEASMWGDYHALELALYLKRLTEQGTYLDFFSCATKREE